MKKIFVTCILIVFMNCTSLPNKITKKERKTNIQSTEKYYFEIYSKLLLQKMNSGIKLSKKESKECVEDTSLINEGHTSLVNKSHNSVINESHNQSQDIPGSSKQSDTLSTNQQIPLNYENKQNIIISKLNKLLSELHWINSEVFLEEIEIKIFSLSKKAKFSGRVIILKTRRYNSLIEFLNYDISSIINFGPIPACKSKYLSLEELYDNFEKYLKNFNSMYESLVNKNHSYFNKYTFLFDVKGDETDSYAYNFLFTENTLFLNDLIPELSNYDLILNQFPFSSILKQQIHSIFTLLIIKYYTDIDKLYDIVNKKIKSDSYIEDILRLRTIFYLIPMNDPILINYSFETFFLCFISFIDYIESAVPSEEFLKDFIINFLWQKFNKFLVEMRYQSAKKYYEFFKQNYIPSLRNLKNFQCYFQAFNYSMQLTPEMIGNIIRNFRIYQNDVKGLFFFKDSINTIHSYIFEKRE